MVVGVVKEFAAVGEKEGIHLDVDEAVKHVEDCYRVIGAHYPSMYQDLVKNNRRTEIDYINGRSEEHTSELQSRFDLVCRLLLEKKKKNIKDSIDTAHKNISTVNTK